MRAWPSGWPYRLGEALVLRGCPWHPGSRAPMSLTRRTVGSRPCSQPWWSLPVVDAPGAQPAASVACPPGPDRPSDGAPQGEQSLMLAIPSARGGSPAVRTPGRGRSIRRSGKVSQGGAGRLLAIAAARAGQSPGRILVGFCLAVVRGYGFPQGLAPQEGHADPGGGASRGGLIVGGGPSCGGADRSARWRAPRRRVPTAHRGCSSQLAVPCPHRRDGGGPRRHGTGGGGAPPGLVRGRAGAPVAVRRFPR